VKARIFRQFAVWGLPLLGSACQSTAPSPELKTARDVYGKAESSRAADVAPADLREAERALKSAEAAHEQAPRSPRERSYAYLAVRKAQLAMAKADADAAEAEQLHAAQVVGARPYAELLGEARSELARRERELEERERAWAAESAAREQVTVEQSSGAEGQLSVSGVFFETESADLSPEAQSQLDQLAEELLAQDDQRLVIRGYADARGPRRYNQALSRARALAVREYLVSRGVPEDRVRAEALGERLPIARNDTPSGRSNNRRVEIVVAPTSAVATDDTAPSARRRQEQQGTDQGRQNVSGKDKPGEPKER
jgi:outer membrane protein OmpA-like peptidoglycan-associated protein